jgi:hypothetical protein
LKKDLKESKEQVKILKEKHKEVVASESYFTLKAAYEFGAHRDLEIDLGRAMQTLIDHQEMTADMEKELDDLKEAAEYLVDVYAPKVEGELQGLVERLDGVVGRIKALLMDGGKLAAATALAVVKHHEPSFDLERVKEEIDLAQAVDSEDIQAAAEEVMKKINLQG